MNYFSHYLVTLATFLVLDSVWLGIIAPSFYQKYIGHLMRSPIQWTAAGLFYLIFMAGLLVFVIEPSLQQSHWMKPMFLGALFGLVTYATYDLTNQAVLKQWPTIVTVVDLAWGTFITSVTSVIVFFILKK